MQFKRLGLPTLTQPVFSIRAVNPHSTRRRVLGMLAATVVVPRAALAQSSLLPVNTAGLDHLDVIVPDVEKAARFYMGLFRTRLHAQPFQGAQRYFVLLGPLPEDRAVGYLAIGASNGRGTYIGHFCTSVVEWRRDSTAIFAALKQSFRAAGFGEFNPVGNGTVFQDPDGNEVQFLPSPDTLGTAAVPSELVPAEQGLVTPQRAESVLVLVSDFKRALEFYRTVYGKESRSNAGTATFAFRNGTRLELERTDYVYGSAKPRIARFGVRVKPFDRAAVAAGIAALGGTVLVNDGRVLRLKDTDGIELELVTG